jgi:phospholipid/cholesterol/gamma-HCH transport system permease protein
MKSPEPTTSDTSGFDTGPGPRKAAFMIAYGLTVLSGVLGAVIGYVGCYKGFNAGRGTESVGIAANSAVVLSSLLLIIVDLIAVQITDLL